MSEEDYKKELAEAGVDLPELKDTPEKEPKAEEPKAPAAEPVKPEKDEPEKPEAPLQEPKEQRKRSIYDDLKDERKDRKEAIARAELAERERDELKAKLDAAAGARTPAERTEALDDVDEFLSKHKEWDKDAIKEFIGLTRKGLKPEIPEELSRDLAEFKAWKSANQSSIEKQMFEDEFKSATPKLEKMFGKASPDEMNSIKAELDKLSHSKEWHDKPLAYIAFENQDTLAALVSPRKRGMESKDRKEIPAGDVEFDINADYASMTPEQREKWEAEYKRATASGTGLLTDAQGRKSII